MHSKDFQIYSIILQLICFAKELEFLLKAQYNLNRNDILRCFVEKKIPHTGIVVHQAVEYMWRFHGLGITWHSASIRFHYNILPLNPTGVIFTSFTIRDFIQYKKIDFTTDVHELDVLLLDLNERNLIVRTIPEYETYCLS
jgi:hypothetical protein